MRYYRFQKYNRKFIEHIRERHFPFSPHVGSVFTARELSTPRLVAEFAYNLINHADRNEKPYEKPFPFILVHDCKKIIGLDSLVPINEIPKGTTVKDEIRNRYPVKVAYGIKRRPTQTVVIIAGPIDVDDMQGLHACYTVYPGTYAPDLINANKRFWSEWAFIEENIKHHKKERNKLIAE